MLEVIETLHAIQTGNLASGSPARVTDCCPQPRDPFQCIFKMGGICLAADYPTTTGQCIPNNFGQQGKGFICICKEGYSGDRCEHIDSRIDISFHSTIKIDFKLTMKIQL